MNPTEANEASKQVITLETNDKADDDNGKVNDSGVELIEKMWKKWIDMMDKEEFKEEVFAMCDPPDSYTTSSDYGDALYAALDFVKRKKFQLWAHWAEQIRLEYNISQEDLDSVKLNFKGLEEELQVGKME